MTRAWPLGLLLCLPGCLYAPIDLDLGGLGKVKEVVVVPGDDEQKVLMLRIDGEISSEPDSGFFGSDPSLLARVMADLDRARDDPSVRGVLVRIDSPGGGVTASDLIHHELQRFQTERQVPVVAWFGDTAASGGYYVAMAADEIVASPTTITGSIGVIAQVLQVHELGEKIGVSIDAITSGANKDVGSPFRPLTPADRAQLQALIDAMHARFVDVVAAGRAAAGLTREQVAALADGRVFTGPQALDAKLVDQIGYFEDAYRALVARGQFDGSPQVIVYEEGGLGGSSDSTRYSARAGGVSLQVEAGGPSLDVARRLLPGSGPALQYLWTPGR